jgi:hypothetical protein
MEKSAFKKLSAVMAALLFIVMVTANGLANALPLNGVNTGQLSDEIPNLFVPAGLTFAIWGLIYALLFGYVIAGLVAAFGKKGHALWTAGDGWIFSINAALNTAWIFAWHWRMVGLSLVLMLGILLTLLLLLERGFKANAAYKAAGGPDSNGQKALGFFLWRPILVYLGWICVATIANVTALLVTAGWNGFGIPELWWTVLVIAVGAIVGLYLVLQRGAVSSGLVVIWAYAGIVLKRGMEDPVATMPIIIAAVAGAILVAAASAYQLVLRRKA